MNPILLTMLDLLAKSTGVLLLAWAVQSLWRSASAAQRCLIWLAAFAVVLLLPLTLLVHPLWTVQVADRAPTPAPAPLLAPVVSNEPALPTWDLPSPPVVEKAASWEMPQLNVWEWLGITWLLGAVVLLTRHALGTLQLRRLHAQSSACEETWMQQRMAQLASRLGVRRTVDLRISDKVSVPLTWGFFKPVLMLPETSREWTEARVEAALCHELGHIRHWDALARLLTTLACALQWPHALLWLAAKSWRTAQEQACDDLVLNSGASTEDYAMQLLDSARAVQSLGFVYAPALTMALPSTLETRLTAIMDEKRNRRPMGRIAVLTGAATAATLLLLCSTLQVRAEDKIQAKPETAAVDPPGTATPSAGTTVLPAQVEINVRVVQADDAAKLQQLSDLVGGKQAVLMDSIDWYKNILPSLSQRAGVDLMTTPPVTTRSGKKGTIAVGREVQVDGEKIFLGVSAEFLPVVNGKDVTLQSTLLMRDGGIPITASHPLDAQKIDRAALRERKAVAEMNLHVNDMILLPVAKGAQGQAGDLFFLVTVSPFKNVNLSAMNTSYDPQTHKAKASGQVKVTVTSDGEPPRVWKGEANEAELDSDNKEVVLWGHPRVTTDNNALHVGTADDTKMVLQWRDVNGGFKTTGPSETYIRSNLPPSAPASPHSVKAQPKQGHLKELNFNGDHTSFDPKTQKGKGSGSVTVTTNDDPPVIWKGEADEAEYDLDKMEVVLHGHAKVSREGSPEVTAKEDMNIVLQWRDPGGSFSLLKIASASDTRPEDRYFTGYQLKMEAERLAQKSDWAGAVKKYEEARKIITEVARDFPSWQPEMLKYRFKAIDTELAWLAGKSGKKNAASIGAEPSPKDLEKPMQETAQQVLAAEPKAREITKTVDQQRIRDSADPTREKAETYYTDKMQRIVFPKIQFSGASVEEAIAFLRDKSRDLDTEEKDPGKKGVSVVLMSGTKSVVANRISLDLHEVPMVEALRYITELAHLKFKVMPPHVIVYPPDQEKDLAEAPRNDDVVHAEVKPSPAPAPNTYYTQKLETLIIPQVIFKDATLEEALDFLRVKSKAVDSAEMDEKKKGVNILLRPGSVPNTARLTLDLHDVPLGEALRYITELSHTRFKVEPYAVIVSSGTQGDPAAASVSYFTVFGQVKRQGKYEFPASGELTVSQALTMAGGVTDSKANKVHLVRRTTEPGKNKTINVNLDDILKLGQTAKDVAIHPNDVIIVDFRNFPMDSGDEITPSAPATLLLAGGTLNFTSAGDTATGRVTAMETLDDKMPLKVGDILNVTVVDDPRHTEVRVMPSGKVEMPNLPPVKAAGLTCKKLAEAIKGLLEKQKGKAATVLVWQGAGPAPSGVVTLTKQGNGILTLAAAPAPEAAPLSSPLQVKADKLIIPSVFFKEATLEEALEFLRSKSNELNPDKTGVKIINKGDPQGPSSKARISMQLHDIPLTEALRYVANLSSLELTVKDDAFVLVELGRGKASAAPAAPVPASSPASPATSALKEKADQIILPKVIFSGASLEQIVDCLRMMARDLDPAKTGVNILIKTATPPKASITLNLTNVPLSEALHYVAELANLKLSTDEHSYILEDAAEKEKKIILPNATPPREKAPHKQRDDNTLLK